MEECTISGKIDILNLSIGRGHPFYLDGLIEALIRRGATGLVRRHLDVLDICTGVSGAGWRSAQWLYRHGASNRIVGQLYHLIRRQSDYNNPSLSLRIMGKPLVAMFSKGSDPLVVSHPTLVGILANRSNLFYQHGELVAPDESLVRGASVLFVPTHEVADKFLASGYSRGQLLVSGLCIEPALLRSAEDYYRARADRLDAAGPLCGLYVSSGAEPITHIKDIVTSAVSAIRHAGKAIVLVRRGGRLEDHIIRAVKSERIPAAVIDSGSPVPADLPQMTIVAYTGRREENHLTESVFRHLDYFVAPAHERVNWAMGLGLPMIVLTPSIGPFAPLNLELVRKSGVARIMREDVPPEAFGRVLNRLHRTGELSAMSERGWRKYPIDGFLHIADYLITHVGA